MFALACSRSLLSYSLKESFYWCSPVDEASSSDAPDDYFDPVSNIFGKTLGVLGLPNYYELASTLLISNVLENELTSFDWLAIGDDFDCCPSIRFGEDKSL